MILLHIFESSPLSFSRNQICLRLMLVFSSSCCQCFCNRSLRHMVSLVIVNGCPLGWVVDATFGHWNRVYRSTDIRFGRIATILLRLHILIMTVLCKISLIRLLSLSGACRLTQGLILLLSWSLRSHVFLDIHLALRQRFSTDASLGQLVLGDPTTWMLVVDVQLWRLLLQIWVRWLPMRYTFVIVGRAQFISIQLVLGWWVTILIVLSLSSPILTHGRRIESCLLAIGLIFSTHHEQTNTLHSLLSMALVCRCDSFLACCLLLLKLGLPISQHLILILWHEISRVVPFSLAIRAHRWWFICMSPDFTLVYLGSFHVLRHM